MTPGTLRNNPTTTRAIATIATNEPQDATRSLCSAASSEQEPGRLGNRSSAPGRGRASRCAGRSGPLRYRPPRQCRCSYGCQQQALGEQRRLSQSGRGESTLRSKRLTPGDREPLPRNSRHGSTDVEKISEKMTPGAYHGRGTRGGLLQENYLSFQPFDQLSRLYFEMAIQRRPKVTLSTCSGSNSSSAVVGTPCVRAPARGVRRRAPVRACLWKRRRFAPACSPAGTARRLRPRTGRPHVGAATSCAASPPHTAGGTWGTKRCAA